MLIIKILFIIFDFYLTQLGLVWEFRKFSGMQFCVLLGSAVPILTVPSPNSDY